jgi:hypothetical protein
VDEEFDTGPILAQRVVAVDPLESHKSLAAKVLKQVRCATTVHTMYCAWLACGTLTVLLYGVGGNRDTGLRRAGVLVCTGGASTGVQKLGLQSVGAVNTASDRMCRWATHRLWNAWCRTGAVHLGGSICRHESLGFKPCVGFVCT